MLTIHNTLQYKIIIVNVFTTLRNEYILFFKKHALDAGECGSCGVHAVLFRLCGLLLLL